MISASIADGSRTVSASDGRPADRRPAGIADAGRALPRLAVGQKLGYATVAVLDEVASQAIDIFLFFYATAVIAFASMMADAADERENLFGARQEGLHVAG